MRGNITRRGAHSWRIKFEAGERDLATGARRTRYVTVRGTKREAQAELTRRLAEIDAGISIDPSRVTVAEHLRDWLGTSEGLSPKTLERYRQLAERQIIPHLGAVMLQKLRAKQITSWHTALSATGLPHAR
jgi:integrase